MSKKLPKKLEAKTRSGWKLQVKVPKEHRKGRSLYDPEGRSYIADKLRQLALEIEKGDKKKRKKKARKAADEVQAHPS